MYLDQMNEEEVVDLNIPTAIPLVYEFDPETLQPLHRYYLVEDQEKLQKAIEAVAKQTSTPSQF
jgi:2,3-bisphosphoglycerate-dependent phosphoglycerate mutase